jgi:hypothetical protein
VNKKNLVLLAILFLFFSGISFAQTDGTGTIEHFSLYWESDQYTWNYEVTVEKMVAGKFTEIQREKTEKTEVPCSLTTGSYRYQVTAYDFFGRASGISEWSYFQIIPGQPVTIEMPRTIIQPINPEEEPPVEEPEPLPVVEDLPVPEAPPYDSEPGNFFVEAAYSPLLSLPNTDFNQLYSFQPGGASARLWFIPFKFRLISLGFELAPSWSYLSATEDNYSVYAHLIDIPLGLIGQFWLPNGRMAVNLRLSGGLTLLNNFHFEYSGQQNKDQITTWIPSIHGGAFFLWIFRAPFFAEIGVELFHLFSVDNIPLEFVRPSLGVGMSF